MTVKELKEILADYNDNAIVTVIDWSNGRTYTPAVGSDDKKEFTERCSISFD